MTRQKLVASLVPHPMTVNQILSFIIQDAGERWAGPRSKQASCNSNDPQASQYARCVLGDVMLDLWNQLYSLLQAIHGQGCARQKPSLCKFVGRTAAVQVLY
jgi:hypothetical protein